MWKFDYKLQFDYTNLRTNISSFNLFIHVPYLVLYFILILVKDIIAVPPPAVIKITLSKIVACVQRSDMHLQCTYFGTTYNTVKSELIII